MSTCKTCLQSFNNQLIASCVVCNELHHADPECAGLLSQKLCSISSLTNGRTIQEIQKCISRSKNLLLLNVTDTNYMTKDQTTVMDILGHTSVNMDNMKVLRVGNQVGSEPRPLLITLTQQDVMRLLKNKNRTGKNYLVADDRTRLQQNQYKNAANRLLKRTQGGERNLMIRYINNSPTVIKLPELKFPNNNVFPSTSAESQIDNSLLDASMS
ncbi:hypothetical protein QAD02_007891 [Eretmocerus hayati]|uniref:Uncharacterized protein n=1 Tax=Eretmocerus hayati TaxID=131215 RepID=A0ACC2N7C1_9HYME|nr:hypothetical protein QAD02_007891 [Eretmocerus hayati]